MSGYTLNGNPWGGSFILEASTNGTSWEPMVAKSSNDTFLSREGLATGGGIEMQDITRVNFLIQLLVFTNHLILIHHLQLCQTLVYLVLFL